MTALRWLASPLTGTVGVLTGLGFLSIPLRELTSRPAKPEIVVKAEISTDQVSAVLRLKLLAPAKHVTVEDAKGSKLIELAEAPAGESEHEARFLLESGHADLTLSVDFGDAESAAFLTVMPDGREDQTRYLIGSGETSETLTFAWPAH
jgi:hypothetical protein